MAVWAIISALTAVSQNYTGLLLTRFFLGITEAPYYPGALYVLATFYTRKELATRISILYTGNILATAFAGLIALGIFQMHGMVGCIPLLSDTDIHKSTGRYRGLEMALHHPGRCHPHHRHNRVLHPPRRTAHNAMAQPRRAHPSQRADSPRHGRKHWPDDNLVRSSGGCQRPQGLAIHSDAALPPGCERVQKLLPDCG